MLKQCVNEVGSLGQRKELHNYLIEAGRDKCSWASLLLPLERTGRAREHCIVRRDKYIR